jgi:O-antigen/teichoic acid export membrane protein
MSSLQKNFAFLTASSLLSPVFSMVLVLAISRVLGVEALGKYSLMMTVFVLGQSCAPLGLPVVITREVAQAHQDAGRYFMSACAITVTLVVAALAVVSGGLRWAMTDVELRWAIELVLVSLVPSVVTAHGEAVLLAFERAGDFVVLNLIENAVRAAIGTVLVVLGYGIVGIAVVLLALRVATGGAFLVVLRRRGVPLPAPIDRRLCRHLLRYVPVLGSIPIVNAIYARADIFLLTWLGTWTEVGLYSAGLRLVDVTRSIPPAYARALYPILSRLRASATEEFATVARRSIRNILLLVVPIALLLSGLAQPVIVLLYGPNLVAGAASLQVLAWALVPMALATTLAQMLFSADRQAIDLRVNIIATVVSVAAGGLMIPRWGAVGAASAILVSTSVYATLQYVFVCQIVADVSALGQMGKLFAIAVASSLLMFLTVATNAVMAGIVGLGTYGAGIVITRIMSRKDIQRAWLVLSSTGSSGRSALRHATTVRKRVA